MATRDVGTGELCKAFGISRRTLQTWLREDLPHEQRKEGRYTRNYFDPAEVREWLERAGRESGQREPRAGGVPIGQSPRLGGPRGAGGDGGERPVTQNELRAAELRKRLAQAAKLELEVEKRRGELVDKKAAEDARVAKFALVRDRLLAVPAKVGSEVGDPAIEAAMREAIIEALRELST